MLQKDRPIEQPSTEQLTSTAGVTWNNLPYPVTGASHPASHRDSHTNTWLAVSTGMPRSYSSASMTPTARRPLPPMNTPSASPATERTQSYRPSGVIAVWLLGSPHGL